MIKPFLAALVAMAAIAPAAQAVTPAYRTTVLQALDDTDWIAAYGINDAGAVVGFSTVQEPWGRMNGVVWQDDGVPSLLPLPGAYPRSSGDVINNRGDVLGWGDEASYDPRYSFVVRDGVARDLSQQSPGFEGRAMNDAGQIVGVRGSQAGVLDPDGGFTPISLPSVGTPWHYHIADDGAVATTLRSDGSDGTPFTGYNSAALWRGGEVTVLAHATVIDMDRAGTVLVDRASETGAPLGQALWDGEHLTDVATSPLGGSFMALNDRGDMVGAYRFNGGGAEFYFARLGGQDVKLEDLLDPAMRAAGWTVDTGPLQINNRGQILTGAWDPVRQRFSAVVLSPVPEPASLVLALAGAAVIGLSARRRSAV